MLDTLREHHAALTALLHSQRELKTDDLQIGARILINIYAAILQDGISTLNSLIEFLDKR